MRVGRVRTLFKDVFYPDVLGFFFFRPMRCVTSRLRYFGVLDRNRQWMSAIIEMSAAIVSRTPVRLWWSIPTASVVVMMNTLSCDPFSVISVRKGFLS